MWGISKIQNDRIQIMYNSFTNITIKLYWKNIKYIALQIKQ